jgi:transposase
MGQTEGEASIMAEDTLFELPEAEVPKAEWLTSPRQARVLRPVRNQMEWVERNLDASLPDDHPARAVWAFLERLDLSAFYASIKSVLGHAGHPTTDPQVLLALWLYATSEGIGSARQIDRLCQEHDAYRWLCGGVAINYHTLSDFRVAHQEALDQLLTEILATMMDAGLVKLQHVAQDGMRVRASAGRGSFRRESSLQRCLAEAEQQVAKLAVEREQPDPGRNARQEAARKRAAAERQQRVENALRRMPQVQAEKERRKKNLSKAKREKVPEARVSTTDPECRVMKMADGGFRPAYNLQLAADEDSQVVVGVAVDTTGSDGGQAPAVLEQVERRTGRVPEAYLMDGGFAKREDITTLEQRGVTVYAPAQGQRTTTSGRTKGSRSRGDTPEVVRWRERMETEEAKEIYKRRGATIECVNAHARRHGLMQLLVRGVDKVLSVLLLAAIAHNLLRWRALEAAACAQAQAI